MDRHARCRRIPGWPALAVLQGSGLGDVAVVVTRYFGGTKLGTGGLVRAYSEAAVAALDRLFTKESMHMELLENQPDEEREERLGRMARELDALDELVSELLGYVRVPGI